MPPVLIGGVTPWRYRYRDSFMGVVPRNLNDMRPKEVHRPFLDRYVVDATVNLNAAATTRPASASGSRARAR